MMTTAARGKVTKEEKEMLLKSFKSLSSSSWTYQQFWITMFYFFMVFCFTMSLLWFLWYLITHRVFWVIWEFVFSYFFFIPAIVVVMVLRLKYEQRLGAILWMAVVRMFMVHTDTSKRFVEVSLSKARNPELLWISWLILCMAAAAMSVWTWHVMNIS